MCSLHYVFVRFRHNPQVCGFGDGIIDAMIHLDIVLSLPGLLENVDHDVIIDVLYGKSSVYCNEVHIIWHSAFWCIPWPFFRSYVVIHWYVGFGAPFIGIIYFGDPVYLRDNDVSFWVTFTLGFPLEELTHTVWILVYCIPWGLI